MSQAVYARRSVSGVTLVECIVALTVLAVLMGGVCSGAFVIQSSFREDQTVSLLYLRGQRAMERIVATASQAITRDDQFQILSPTQGDAVSMLRFRLIEIGFSVRTGANQQIEFDQVPEIIPRNSEATSGSKWVPLISRTYSRACSCVHPGR